MAHVTENHKPGARLVVLFSSVLHQSLFPCESHLAGLTDVRFVPRVGTMMTTEVTGGQETLMTLPTDIRSFASVDS